MSKSEDSLKGAKLELVRDDKKAAHSPNTRLVASALACGFKYGTDKPFMESYEEVDGETQVSVTWLMDASTKVPFPSRAVLVLGQVHDLQRQRALHHEVIGIGRGAHLRWQAELCGDVGKVRRWRDDLHPLTDLLLDLGLEGV